MGRGRGFHAAQGTATREDFSIIPALWPIEKDCRGQETKLIEHEDPDSSTTSTDFHYPSTGLEGFEYEAVSPDLQKTDSTTHMCVYDPQSFHNSENTEKSEPASTTPPPSLCDPGKMEGQDPKSTRMAGIDE